MSGGAIPALVARAIPEPAKRAPATPDELERMRSVARMTDELVALYALTGELGLDDFELFEPELFIDVNADRDAFDELADLTYFAADYGSGFFAVDPLDRIGLGDTAIVYAQRGDMQADALVPCGDTLALFLEHALGGEQVWKGLTLGARAENRLMARMSDLPSGVEPGPPLDPMAFVDARARDLFVPMPLARMLEQANGLWFGPERRIYRFEDMHRAQGAEAVVIGEDAALGQIAVTLGGWRQLPADRLIAYAPGTSPERGRPLGRTADVIAMWIEEMAQR